MPKYPISRIMVRAAACIAAICGLTACSPDQVNLLSTVPDSSAAVMTFNAERFMAKAGLTVQGDALTAEPSIAHSPFDLSPLGAGGYASFMASIDSHHMVFFVDSRRTPFITAIITDNDAFRKFTEPYGEPTDEMGFETWNAPDGLKITRRDGQTWISRDQRPAASLKAVLENAAEASVMQSIGVANALQDNSRLFTFQLNSGGEYRIIAAGDENSEILGIDISAMKPDGELMTLNQTQTLSTDFLRYAGPEMILAAAVGLRKEFTAQVDWNRVATYIENMTGLGASPISMIAPLMADVDGTVSVALGPVAPEGWEEPSATTWHIQLMAHMPQGRIAEALNTFRGYFALGGLKVTTDARTGMMSVPFYGSTLYLGEVDGYLAIANTPMSPTAENQLTTTFEGQQGALAAQLPALDFVPGMNKGMDITMQLETQRLKVKVKPVEPESPVLGSILGLFVSLAL